MCFPVNFTKSLTTPFTRKTSRGRLLPYFWKKHSAYYTLLSCHGRRNSRAMIPEKVVFTEIESKKYHKRVEKGREIGVSDLLHLPALTASRKMN